MQVRLIAIDSHALVLLGSNGDFGVPLEKCSTFGLSWYEELSTIGFVRSACTLGESFTSFLKGFRDAKQSIDAAALPQNISREPRKTGLDGC
jgi:hypothetical protein